MSVLLNWSMQGKRKICRASEQLSHCVTAISLVAGIDEITSCREGKYSINPDCRRRFQWSGAKLPKWSGSCSFFFWGRKGLCFNALRHRVELGVSCAGQELDSVSLVGLFQPRTFCDTLSLCSGWAQDWQECKDGEEVLRLHLSYTWVSAFVSLPALCASESLLLWFSREPRGNLVGQRLGHGLLALCVWQI